ncbi:MAG: sensor histidine kinase [Lachnospiraceae bacterium]
MIFKNRSNLFYFFTGTLMLIFSAIMMLALYVITQNTAAVLCGLVFSLIVILINISVVLFTRRTFVTFTSEICVTLDSMLAGGFAQSQPDNSETLFAKINHRLIHLYEIMQKSNNRINAEKKALQELISDISHQVKTPIASLKMVNSTLLEQDVPQEKQKSFLISINDQLNKLDFLMQSIIKTSRLEVGIINLEKTKQPLYDTLAMALGGILIPAENKNITVEVACPEKLILPHDRKWTSEALFNILDNAVKYTSENGHIDVTVEQWELYTKIDIKDTGKGIIESHHAKIFKRFYREEEVHDIDGIGIGLYLSREIITRQGGYIKVSSPPGGGSVFSVFLARR